MTAPTFIRPHRHRALTGEKKRPRAAPELAPELLRGASRRLERVGYIHAAAVLVALSMNTLARAAGWYAMPDLHAVVLASMIPVSATMAWLSRSGRVSARRLLDLGLIYEVVIAFGMSMAEHLTPLSSQQSVEQISWVCLWIAMFPLVVPASPVKTLAAGLAAATTWPLALWIGVTLGNPAPAGRFILLNSLEGYIAAVLALVPTLVIGRLGAAVQKAREMGSYHLVERLDRGGMGEVWRARHRMLARPAAIKLIRPEALGARDQAEADSLMRRFEREAQATAGLNSPHTIDLYDFGVTADGTFYYVMEILDGLDLERLVDRFGPLPAERVVHLLLQACDSLADAHHSGLVHRDVKPANLYLCRKGLRHDFLKVLDFGLVKSCWRDQDEESRLTSENSICGTPAYMAPEIALGGEVDARADIYALGCVGYWLITGKKVFEATTPMEMVTRHVVATPAPPSQRTDLGVPPALERLILACLEKDPHRRPSGAEEIARQLAAFEMESAWTPERARCWWETHLPLPARPEAS